ncbi:MAG: hypothetical protein V7L01_12710 [Nostoc sp.]|uniref:hypothetical protein n=1 Tax=Nostoc sp. TaxID=1180 RepID=UPI002FF8CEBE
MLKQQRSLHSLPGFEISLLVTMLKSQHGTLHLYKDMVACSAKPQHLLVGPWAHLPWGHKVGEIDFGKLFHI